MQNPFGTIKKHLLILIFFASHLIFIGFIQGFTAFSPDENGYLFTFNNLYTLPINTMAQSGSGWVSAPTIFLWIAYLPAKLISLVGVPGLLALRIESAILIAISFTLFRGLILNDRRTAPAKEFLVLSTFFIPSIFFWTSTGLREAFILCELSLFFTGITLLNKGASKKGFYLVLFGSFGLVSTKPYLWAVLMIATFITVIYLFINKLKIK